MMEDESNKRGTAAMSLEIQIKAKEDEADELLQLAATLFLNNLIDKDRFLELGFNILESTSRETLDLINENSQNKGYPILEEATAIGLMLDRVRADLEAEASDFIEYPELEESIRTRLGQTAWYTCWKTYGEAIQWIAAITGRHIHWIVVLDDRTCDICISNEQGSPYPFDKLPPYPAHNFCRCTLSIV